MNFVAYIIIACEISFWAAILVGLVTRYIFKRKTLGLFILALIPLIDVILLAVTAIDLYHGATATVAHSIAPLYIGISLAFGKSMIQWADERFQYYVTKQGPKPIRRTGYPHAIHSMKGSLRHVVAFAIGVPMIFFVKWYIDSPERTLEFDNTLRLWTIILGVDLLISASYFIWPRPKRTASKS
ncbi:hypothetical protein DVB69_15855 [Sporosarcina sp. BI001-red]|uniref:hypothetical protein n=1 Tax=Sporosarcina sp. BI001-red TaxID=2282866 RepID=UPI000E27342B|nr:hypothetical protein [Sporosarcina sp. BI001-red]REB05229.1 hypothetical protein DVB69_15855 [Sporosarcina sp. BI001-red]